MQNIYTASAVVVGVLANRRRQSADLLRVPCINEEVTSCRRGSPLVKHMNLHWIICSGGDLLPWLQNCFKPELISALA